MTKLCIASALLTCVCLMYAAMSHRIDPGSLKDGRISLTLTCSESDVGFHLLLGQKPAAKDHAGVHLSFRELILM